jgi:signal transduction histidine kinase
VTSPAGSSDREPAGEARLRAIIDHVADGIVIVSSEGIMRFVNRAGAELFGRTATELLGQPFGHPVVEDERAEIDIVHKSGHTAVAELRVADIDWEGEPSLLVSLRDVTDRNEAEDRRRDLIREQGARERAEAEKRRFRFLAEAGAALDSSLDYREVFARLAALIVSPESAFGVAPEASDHPPRLADWCLIDVIDHGKLTRVAAVHHESAKQPLLDELRDNFRPDLERPFPAAQVIRERKAILFPELDRAHLVQLTESEEHADLIERIGVSSAMAAPLIARGEPVGALTFACADRSYTEEDLALANDLARRAALSITNAQLYDEAKQANRAKSDFLAVMSHELRTPLNAIIGYTDLLEAGVTGPLNESQIEQLGRISDSSAHLLSIVDEILTYSRTEAGQERLKTGTVELSDVLREVAAVMEPIAQRKDLALRVDATDETFEIETDQRKVRQILLNLVSNAIKFTESGEINISISRDVGGVLIEVRDTGIGIADEHLSRIFEPFWQIEQTSTRAAGGTGLGLSVARRLAVLLGGSISSSSKPGAGSTFSLRLPPTPPAQSERADGTL